MILSNAEYLNLLRKQNHLLCFVSQLWSIWEKQKLVFWGNWKNVRKRKSSRACAFLVMLDRRRLLWPWTNKAAWVFIDVRLYIGSERIRRNLNLDHLLGNSRGTPDELTRLVFRTCANFWDCVSGMLWRECQEQTCWLLFLGGCLGDGDEKLTCSGWPTICWVCTQCFIYVSSILE